MLSQPTREQKLPYLLGGLAVIVAAALVSCHSAALAQTATEETAGPSAQLEDEGPGTPRPATQSPDEAAPAPTVRQKLDGINVFSLILKGGWFMLPIFLMSFLVVTFTIERFIALRSEKIIPHELITRLGQLGGQHGGFDPRQAYRLCQQFPSTASNVIRAMLLKVGRPHSEVEHAVAEASEREAERIYANVRWLNLAAAVTPLLGLMGTVWGMIRAFHDTTQLAPGQNKADYLAEGIYVALVTTLGGLAVAIPAAILSHYFEGRITTMFHRIDELLFNLLPQVERYEGRVRFSQKLGDERVRRPRSAPNLPPPPNPPRQRPTDGGRSGDGSQNQTRAGLGDVEPYAPDRRGVSAADLLPGRDAFRSGGPRVGRRAAVSQRGQPLIVQPKELFVNIDHMATSSSTENPDRGRGRGGAAPGGGKQPGSPVGDHPRGQASPTGLRGAGDEPVQQGRHLGL
jgi:biopolymer transport protein ExbB